MPSVDLLEYTAQVENCRQLLKQNINRLSNVLPEEPSLIDCVQVNNALLNTIDTPPDIVEKNRIRFYDADGTLLKTEWLLPGEDATPPENVNADPEYLEFAGWASANEGVLTNLQSDMDYGAYYNFKNEQSTIFITVTEDTTLDFTIRFAAVCDPLETENLIVTLNWGDGTIVTEELTPNTCETSFSYSHTYAAYGDYIITLHSNLPIRKKTGKYNGTAAYFIGPTATSSAYNFFMNAANAKATRKAYVPIAAKNVLNFSNTHPYPDVYVIFREMYGIYYSNRAFILSPKFFNISADSLGASYFYQSAQYAKYYKLPYILDNRAYTDPTKEHTISAGVGSNEYLNDGVVMGKCTVSQFDGTIALRRMTYLGSKVFLGGGGDISQGMPAQRLQYLPTATIQGRINSSSPIGLPHSKILDWSKATVANSEAFHSTDCTTLILPANSALPSQIYTGPFLRTLIVNKDIAVDLYLNFSSQLTDDTFVHLLNNVADLSETSAKEIRVNRSTPTRLENLYVYKLADEYVLSDQIDPQEGSISVLEGFNNKNWTITTTG